MKSLPAFSLLILTGWLATGLTACKREVDVTSPQAVFLRQVPMPVADTVCGSLEPGVFHVASGDTLALDITFSDDEALAQYKLDIHSNFDCHGHANKTEDWSFLSISPLSGREQTVEVRLPVPANVTAGAYHFQVQVLDEAGNSDPGLGFYSILVQNGADTLAPVLTVSEPASLSFSQARGTELVVSGTVADDAPLGTGGNGQLTLFYRDQRSGNSFEALTEVFPAATGTDYAFSLRFTLPLTLIPGGYDFSLRAYDGVNNASTPFRFTVDVTP